MSNSTISVRIDSEVKDKADKLFNELGLNMSSAINVFLRQSIREQSIPFNIYINDDDEELFLDAKKFVDEHIEAFKELAKWEN